MTPFIVVGCLVSTATWGTLALLSWRQAQVQLDVGYDAGTDERLRRAIWCAAAAFSGVVAAGCAAWA